MAEQLSLEIVTPYGPLVDERVDEVVVPGALGEMGILPGHLPLLSSLDTGAIRYTSKGKSKRLFVSWGFVEVDDEGRVILLADTAEKAEEIDLDRAEDARKRAEAALADLSDTTTEEYRKQELKLLRALMRLQVAGK